MSEVICHDWKKPITSRKEFGMGYAGSKMHPYHIPCWVERYENAGWWQSFRMTQFMKLTGKSTKYIGVSAVFFSAIVYGLFFLALVGRLLAGLTPSASAILHAFGSAIVIGILLIGTPVALVWFLQRKQDKRFNEYLAKLPPEEDL